MTCKSNLDFTLARLWISLCAPKACRSGTFVLMYWVDSSRDLFPLELTLSPRVSPFHSCGESRLYNDACVPRFTQDAVDISSRVILLESEGMSHLNKRYRLASVLQGLQMKIHIGTGRQELLETQCH